MSSTIQTALTPDELTELDDFLLADPDERLGIDEAHGFISALLVGHDTRGEAVWLADIWGDSEPAPAERERMTALLRRMHDDIAAMLADGFGFEPLILEEEDEEGYYEVYDGWCYGFMLAVANDQGRWQDLPAEQQDLLEPIAALALLHTDDDAADMSDDDYEACIDLLPGSVAGLHAYFASKMN